MNNRSQPTKIIISERVRRQLVKACDFAYPNETGWANFGSVDGETIRLEDILPLENCSTRPRRSFAWPTDFAFWAETYGKIKELSFLGLGHSHPTPTLPSHADIRVVQSVPGLHIWVLHKEHVHDVRASWGVDDIRVEFETDEITITSFDPLILELPNLRFYFHELPTLCKALSRISVGAIPSDIKSTLGSTVQQERYLAIMLHFRLIEKTSWSGRPRNLSGRKPTCQYALTKKGQRLLALVNKFNRDMKSLLKEERI